MCEMQTNGRNFHSLTKVMGGGRAGSGGDGGAITHMLRWIIPSFVRWTMRARRAGLKKDWHTVSGQQPWRDGSRARGTSAHLLHAVGVSVGFKEETLLNVALESSRNYTEDSGLQAIPSLSFN